MDFLQTLETLLFETLQTYSTQESYPKNLQPSIETLEPIDAKKRLHLIILEIKKKLTDLSENFQKKDDLMKESKQEKEQLLLKTENLQYEAQILLNKILSARIDQKSKNKLINLDILDEGQDELEFFKGGELKLSLEKKLKESEALSSELKLLREKKYDLIRSNTKQETFLRSLRSKIIEIPENCPTTLKFLSLPSSKNQYSRSKKTERSLLMPSALPLPLFALYRTIKQYIRTHLSLNETQYKNNKANNRNNLNTSKNIGNRNVIIGNKSNNLFFNKSNITNQNTNSPQSPQVNIEIIRHNPKTLTCNELKNKSKISRHHLGLTLKIYNITFTFSWIPTLAVLTVGCSKPFLIYNSSNIKENLLFEFDSITFGLALDWIQKLIQDENSNILTKSNPLKNFNTYSTPNNNSNNNNNNNDNINNFFQVLTHKSQKDNFEQFVQIIYNRIQSHQSLKNQISKFSKFDINAINFTEKYDLPLPKAIITKSIEESKNTLIITVRKNRLIINATIKLNSDYPFVFPEFAISLPKEREREMKSEKNKSNFNSPLIKLNHEKHVFINSELTNSRINHKIANMDLQLIEMELNVRFPFHISSIYGNQLQDMNHILSLQTLHFLYCVDKLEKGKRIGKMRSFM
ncbi:tho complex subunit 5 [Anaeramoeba flamelloides]|uniref:Tho complex subunit 5 n=1 Tax=Anaeramoeba flamelloides TaxID=1746091 RepID=A0ABQ8YXS1_9EUKA|nr:tho complex subunit 5 [Anaeramoeba flamelloides]